MPPTTTPLTITLYAPSLDLTIDDLPLRPNASYTAILHDMRTALGAAQAYPYDVKKQPIESFKDIEAGRIVLVGTDYFERPLAEKKSDVLVVQGGAAERAWMDLTPAQKHSHISTHLSHARNNNTSPPIYLTLPRTHIPSRLSSISLSSTPPPSATSLAIIAANWKLPLDAVLGFQGMGRPYGEPEDWDERLLAALALLSEALVGQEGVAAGLIVERMMEGMRGKKKGGEVVVRWEDVVGAARGVYERGME